MKNKHLTLEDRKVIQEGIEQGLSKSAIAASLSKDPSTISKEILRHRTRKARKLFNYTIPCVHLKTCEKKHSNTCTVNCGQYKQKSCLRRDRSPGACNHCPKTSSCTLDHYFYNALKAHETYLYHLSDSRQGVNLSYSEAKALAELIGPLLSKGQSVYQILQNHPEIGLSAKSIYTYIESGVFKEFGIDNFSLRRQVSMKKRKKMKKRKEPVNYEGRRYTDYLQFLGENPFIPTTEMDTLYNHQDGPFIQTFYFQNTGFMIGFLHKEKTSASMASTLDYLQAVLEDDYFKLFSLLLTDRGAEFEKFDLFECNQQTGEFRTHIFYCDPQSPSQKPHVENNHNYVRNVIPNGRSIETLTQEDISLMFSHINSVPRKSLGGKTPYEAFSFFYGTELLNRLGIREIHPDSVTLQPYLLEMK